MDFIFLVTRELTSIYAGIDIPKRDDIESINITNLCHHNVDTFRINHERNDVDTEKSWLYTENQQILFNNVQNPQNININYNEFQTKCNYTQPIGNCYNDNYQNLIRMRSRTNIPPEKTAILEKSLSVSPFPTNEEKATLAEMTGLPAKVINVWFQNRRQRIRKECSTTERSTQSQF